MEIVQEKYSIGKVVAMLEVSTHTLRFYDERGLVRPVCTEENGYRSYERGQIRQMELILFLKDLGFSLKQVKILIQNRRGGKPLELPSEQQYQENRQKINELTAKQKQIEHLQKIGVLSVALTNFSGITSIMGKENKMTILRRKMWLYIIMWVVIELIGIGPMYALRLDVNIAVVIAMLGAIVFPKCYYDRVECVCPNCGDVSIPSFLILNLAPHIPRFRKLTYPKREKRSYCLEICRDQDKIYRSKNDIY